MPCPQDASALASHQASLTTQADLLEAVWEVMLYGGPTLPDAAADGVDEQSSGFLFTAAAHADLAFKERSCMRADASQCFQPTSPFYQVRVVYVGRVVYVALQATCMHAQPVVSTQGTKHLLFVLHLQQLASGWHNPCIHAPATSLPCPASVVLMLTVITGTSLCQVKVHKSPSVPASQP